MAGPLSGLKIVEMAGLGPGPFAAMMLADHGAEVVRVERAGMIGVPNDPLLRSRRSISLDLKQEAAREVVRRLAESADGLIEGYRPGVMERLGLGPEELLKANPKLVYGRVTGWGQEGPLAQEAGHDINYIAITGLLHGIGPKERPMVPINYLGDYAGGGMMLAFGMVAALLAVQRGGKGQVIDAAMSDGAALVGALTYGMRAAGHWRDEREANLLDGGEPTYGIYRCLRRQISRRSARSSRSSATPCSRGWPLRRAPAMRRLRRSSRPAPATNGPRISPGTDACVAPVLDLGEAPVHPHNIARRSLPRPGRRLPARASAALFRNGDSTGPIRRAGKGRMGTRSWQASAIPPTKSRGFAPKERCFEPALRADGNQRVRAHVARRSKAWCGQSGAGVSRFRLAAGNIGRGGQGGCRRQQPICAVARPSGAARGGCRHITARHQGLDLSPENICVTSGATEALAAAILATVEPGDEVIIFTPAYDAYAPLIRRAGGLPVEVALAAAGLADRAGGAGGGDFAQDPRDCLQQSA